MKYKKWEGPKLACGLAFRNMRLQAHVVTQAAACCPKPLLHLKQRSFFFHFLYCTNGVDTWGTAESQKQSQNQNQNQNQNQQQRQYNQHQSCYQFTPFT
ncbi:hypothetical protein [Undibacterium umbellatum]|uniref:Uncharacterized protein n=1 Tax=Undibacterium umbellatum TaxID=2762300 RepID=A0ABR6Z7U8_9BURK|nr:hypothetical protein [Undibacterium umbellatum]MBC3907834.1 hypothetical protein [Undibacterium umbellatum]